MNDATKETPDFVARMNAALADKRIAQYASGPDYLDVPVALLSDLGVSAVEWADHASENEEVYGFIWITYGEFMSFFRLQSFRVGRYAQPQLPGQDVGMLIEWLGTFSTREMADYTARLATATWPTDVITVDPR